MLRKIILLLLITCNSSYSSEHKDKSENSDKSPVNEALIQVDIHGESINHLKTSLEAIATNTAPDEKTINYEKSRDIKSNALSEKNLKAQERMAHSAFWMMVTSALAFIIGCITLIFLRKTISQNKQLIRSQEEIGKKQVRAYLGINSVETKVIQSGNGIYDLYVKINYVNSGNSPAMKLEMITLQIINGNRMDESKVIPWMLVRDVHGGGDETVEYVYSYEFSESDDKFIIEFEIGIFGYDVFGDEISYGETCTVGLPRINIGEERNLVNVRFMPPSRDALIEKFRDSWKEINRRRSREQEQRV